jgi:hypothetical protein
MYKPNPEEIPADSQAVIDQLLGRKQKNETVSHKK